ncbi:MAG TPA: GNAT family N-acetyltransferase [Ktedonobacterales bacterium]|jgi:ribosomal protein S18 acetylase RimI-like enzyme|nr:GNAT family N-acetyltransferase [Ktedonobacterales bacterium]
MAHETQNGLVAANQLDEDQRRETLALAETCNQLEGLTLKLNVSRDAEGMPANKWLYYDQGALVGYAALDGGPPEAELCGMVAPSHRRKGIGRALLDAVTDACRHATVYRLLLICEDASTSGREFVQAIDAAHSFSELHMEMDAPPAAEQSQSDVLVREATSQDYDALADVLVSAFGGSYDHTRARIEAEAGEGDGRYLVGEVDGQLVGGLKLYEHDGRAGIYAFGVSQEERGKGYGRAILQQTIEIARADGFPRIYLEVDDDNTVARRLYESSGFQTTTTYGYYVVPL